MIRCVDDIREQVRRETELSLTDAQIENMLGVCRACSDTRTRRTASMSPKSPLQLMRDVVQICEPGGRILDLFAGAGTTVLAAVQEGYEAVGIEMSDAYFQRSAERLKTALESEVNQN